MDIFCQIKEKLAKQIVEETANFYVLHDGFPLVEGHLLIIPKKHFRCFQEMDQSLIEEFQILKKRMISFLKTTYTQPVIFEHGIIGQTVLHMHVHLLPTKKSIRKIINKKAIFIHEGTIPYLFYEENNKKTYFLFKNVQPGMLHSDLFAQLLKRPKNGLERAKESTAWLLKVKHKYSLWKKRK